MLSWRPDNSDAEEYSHVLHLVATGEATTKAALARSSGLPRSSVAQRVEALLKSRLLREIGFAPSSGGRPAVQLALNPDAGVVLSADLGATHGHLAIAGLDAAILADTLADLQIGDGPTAILDWVLATFRELLAQVKRSTADVRCITIGVPGPVDFASGTPVRPPIMPGWDGFDVRGYVQRAFDTAVFVDNDVNLMALGEYFGRHSRAEHLLFVKVGTGIGCGIISQGHVHRGADGAAGDIGHIRVAGHDTICHCGNVGCLEAVASASAIIRQLASAEVEAQSGLDIVKLGRDGHPLARRHVRAAGRYIGEVLATLVSFYNPTTIIIGGALAALREDVLAGIRGVIYERALPLATRRLTIDTSQLEERAGVLGGAVLASQYALSPAGLDLQFVNQPRETVARSARSVVKPERN